MISLFRRMRKRLLRENRLTRYLIYAVGEIILVVIGILIALQINNWNEDRKAVLEEHEVIKKLDSDLQKDSVFFELMVERMERTQHLHEQLYGAITFRIPPDSVQDIGLIRAGIFWRPVITKDVEDLAAQIANPDLRSHIREYAEQMAMLEGSKNEFLNVIFGTMRPYLGSQGLLNLESRFEPEAEGEHLNREAFMDHIHDTSFQQIMFEANLKLGELGDKFQGIRQRNDSLRSHCLEIIQTRQ